MQPLIKLSLRRLQLQSFWNISHPITHHEVEINPRDNLLQSHIAVANKDDNGDDDDNDDDDEDDCDDANDADNNDDDGDDDGGDDNDDGDDVGKYVSLKPNKNLFLWLCRLLVNLYSWKNALAVPCPNIQKRTALPNAWKKRYVVLRGFHTLSSRDRSAIQPRRKERSSAQ